MTKYEMKKVFSRTGSKLALLLLVLSLGITCFFALDVTYVDDDGNTRRGHDAVLALRAAQKEWAGFLDEETIRRVIAENKRIRTTPEALSQNVTENEIAYSWGQGIQQIRNLLNCSYADGFREYDYYKADSLSESDAPLFYSNRSRLLKKWLAEEAALQFSDREKAYLLTRYDALAVPLPYDSMIGFRQLFEYAPTIVMLTMLILGYLVAGIFSGEFAWKADAVFFASAHGRDWGTAAKIRAGFCIVTLLYWAIFLLYTGILLGYLGADGWYLPVQSDWTSWKCFYSVTNFQKYLIIGGSGYLGCLFISFLSMLVSAETQSAVPAVMVPVILIFIPSFISNLDTPLVNKILGLLPDQLLQAGTALNFFNLYSFGTKIMGEVPVLLLLYLALLLILLPVLYCRYRHRQIS